MPNTENWFHVVGTRDSTNTLRIWVNTRPPSSTATTSLSFTSADPRIGMNAATSGERWEGRIALVRIYNRALSYEEIIERYNWDRKRFGL